MTTTTEAVLGNDQDDLLLRATIAQSAERWDDMVEIMKKFVLNSTCALTSYQRSLFTIAYKKLVGYRRASWKQIYALELNERSVLRTAKKELEKDEREERNIQPENDRVEASQEVRSTRLRRMRSTSERILASEHRVRIIHGYRISVEHELYHICMDVLNLITSHLLPILESQLSFVLPLLLNKKVSDAADRVNKDDRQMPFRLDTNRNDPSQSSDESGKSAEDQLEIEILKWEETHHVLARMAESTEDSVTLQRESLVFYWKLIADFRRYCSELYPDREKFRNEQCEFSLYAYIVARTLGRALLTAMHPISLAVALNLSSFYYDMMSAPDKACQVAKRAYDEAMVMIQAAEMHEKIERATNQVEDSGSISSGVTSVYMEDTPSSDEKSSMGNYTDAVAIMNLLKQHVTYWFVNITFAPPFISYKTFSLIDTCTNPNPYSHSLCSVIIFLHYINPQSLVPTSILASSYCRSATT